jgi:hypothetical protein
MCNQKLLVHAGQFLTQSYWFKTSPHLHIAVTSHHAYNYWHKKPWKIISALNQTHALAFEAKKVNTPDRLSFPTLHV